MKNKIYIGNLVSFIDSEYFIKLKTIKENALLYKIKDGIYLDITDIEKKEIQNYIEINKQNRTKFITNLPVNKIFVDEITLMSYNPKIYKLIR